MSSMKHRGKVDLLPETSTLRHDDEISKDEGTPDWSILYKMTLLLLMLPGLRWEGRTCRVAVHEISEPRFP